MFRKLLLWSLPLTLAAAGALGQPADSSRDLKDLQKQANRLDKEARLDQGNDDVFNSLSKQLNIPATTLQAQQKSTNFGFGQLFIANSMAAASGKTFDQVSQEFKSGKGWGEIAKENNLKLGKVVSGLKSANKQVEKVRMERMQMHREAAGAKANRNRQGAPRMPAGPRGRVHH